MSEEKKVKVTGYQWRDPELILAEDYPDDVDITHCLIERHEHKDSFFYCPKCNKLDPTPICIDINITHNHPLARVYTEGLELKCSCKECGSDMIPLDRYIAEPVELLCNAGYEVVQACQGNVTAIPGEREDVPEEEDYFIHIDSSPYILFDKDYPEIREMELPEGWFIDDTEYSCIDENDDRFKSIEKTIILKYGISKDFINEELMKEAETDDPLLNMDGYIHFGYGIPCKELTIAIKKFLEKNQK